MYACKNACRFAYVCLNSVLNGCLACPIMFIFVPFILFRANLISKHTLAGLVGHVKKKTYLAERETNREKGQTKH